MRRRDFFSGTLIGGPLSVACADAAQTPLPLRIATFEADVTPPLGYPLSLGYRPPAKRIVDPLSARGIALLGAGPPIVLCAVDWTLIANDAHDAWREALAGAVGTTADRVAVHAIHQHDAICADYMAQKIWAAHVPGGKLCDVAVANEALARVARAAGEAAGKPRRVTHLGHGVGKVEKVASTRRVLTPDGKLEFWRASAGGNKRGKAAPEGLIDPYLRLLSFWDGEEPLVAINYYSCHPCSYYGRGDVSTDFVGMARAAREAALPGVAQIYFSGAGGDIACGKYNDGSPENRPVLAARLQRGMKLAWDAQKKVPITSADLSWRTCPVSLPVRKSITEQASLQRLENTEDRSARRVGAALELAWLRRTQAGHKIVLSCLRIGPTYTLHMPGELFVEYQLAAQKMRPDDFVSMAAYGDWGPGYIGTKIAYGQGGYETGWVSRVAPEVEDVLLPAIRDLLGLRGQNKRNTL